LRQIIKTAPTVVGILSFYSTIKFLIIYTEYITFLSRNLSDFRQPIHTVSTFQNQSVTVNTKLVTSGCKS